MATGKVYYWIKLKDTFFRSDTVDFFMSQPNGANYVVLYQMLHLMTANTDGRFQRQIGEIIIPYDIAKIKRDCKYFSEDTIRVAFELYKQCGLIYEDVDGVLTLTDHSKMVGSETDYAEKKRRQRTEIKAAKRYAELEKGKGDNVPSNVSDNVSISVPTEIRDKRIDINNTPIESGASIDEKAPKVKKRKTILSTDQKSLFDKFYSVYPKKRSVGDAEKAWAKITPNPDDAFVDRLIAAVKAKQDSGEWSNFQYIPFPASWLNARGWEDEITLPVTEAKPRKTDDEIAAERAAYQREIELSERNAPRFI